MQAVLRQQNSEILDKTYIEVDHSELYYSPNTKKEQSSRALNKAAEKKATIDEMNK